MRTTNLKVGIFINNLLACEGRAIRTYRDSNRGVGTIEARWCAGLQTVRRGCADYNAPLALADGCSNKGGAQQSWRKSRCYFWWSWKFCHTTDGSHLRHHSRWMQDFSRDAYGKQRLSFGK